MEMVMSSGKLLSQKAPRLPFDRSLVFACMLLLLGINLCVLRMIYYLIKTQFIL